MESPTSDVQSLSARVEKLEKQNRLFKRAALTLLLLPAAFVVMGQAKPDRSIDVDSIKAKTIEAHLILLRDEDGSSTLVRAGFINVATGDKGIVSITTFGGPSLTLTDDAGYETSAGVSSLVTTQTGEKHQTSAASLVLFGKDKTVLWSAPK